MSAETEIAQGKAVADACKTAGVQHLIFSSLLNTTRASNGRLSHISHFDGKAKIEEYIRQLGIPATFVLPGMFMSGYFNMIRKNEDGSYVLAMPVSEEGAKAPLFDPANDMGGSWLLQYGPHLRASLIENRQICCRRHQELHWK